MHHKLYVWFMQFEEFWLIKTLETITVRLFFIYFFVTCVCMCAYGHSGALECVHTCTHTLMEPNRQYHISQGTRVAGSFVPSTLVGQPNLGTQEKQDAVPDTEQSFQFSGLILNFSYQGLAWTHTCVLYCVLYQQSSVHMFCQWTLTCLHAAFFFVQLFSWWLF